MGGLGAASANDEGPVEAGLLAKASCQSTVMLGAVQGGDGDYGPISELANNAANPIGLAK